MPLDVSKWESVFICIDLKAYYSSVECVYRGLDPLKTNLLVADETRSDKTICLAVSPPLKAIGVGARPRLFEARQSIALYEAQHHCNLYIICKTVLSTIREHDSRKVIHNILQAK